MILEYLRGIRDHLIDLILLTIGLRSSLRLLANRGEEDHLAAARAYHIALQEPRVSTMQSNLAFVRIFNRLRK